MGQSLTEITFTPNSGIDIEVKTFMNAMRIEENTSLIPSTRALGGEATLDLEQASITSMEGFYEGTENAVKKAFDLTHKEDPIFKREFDGVLGTAHTSTSLITSLNRNITFNLGINTDIQTRVNVPYYFNPTESVAIGTAVGVGIGSTISYSYRVIGGGSTERFIPTQNIFLQDHGFETGDKLIYSSDEGTPLLVPME